MDDPRKVILHPVITEKSTRLMEEPNPQGIVQNAYCFKVNPRSRKPEIREAIERIFNVKVKAVQIIWKRGKLRRTRRGGETRTPDWKKAIVTLREGYKIEFY